MSKRCIIILSVIAGVLIAGGIGVLIWWLVRESRYTEPFETIILERDAFGDVKYNAAFTRIPDVGDIFWWFFPSSEINKPILLLLGGVIGFPHSFLLNFGGLGPLDLNLNPRSNSLVEDFHLLFVDGVPGTGFSRPDNEFKASTITDESVDHLIYTLQSFYETNEDYEESPLYILEQGDGSRLALPLAIQLANHTQYSQNLKGIFLGNAIISPAVALTKLGFYLEELAYIDGLGREAIEDLSITTNRLVSQNQFGEAFDQFVSLGEFVNENAGAVAVNLAYIVQKLTRSSTDYFGQSSYVQGRLLTDAKSFMEGTIAPRLGISDVSYDKHREEVIDAYRPFYMRPAVDNVEYILNNFRNISVTIYNGNLDAVSNTPGQLAWLENLNWYGGNDFKASNRRTLSVNGQIEGYFRQYSNLNFFWINVAGLNAALDNTVAVREMLKGVTSHTTNIS